MLKPHLVFDISAHGFGHVAQTAAVLNALPQHQYRITIRSKAPETLLRSRIQQDFDYLPYQQDTGMLMHSALSVDLEKTWQWYQNFHAHFAERVEQASQELAALKPDLLFANVPYLSLAAAGELAIPSLALCSLNWADIFKAYLGNTSEGQQIYKEILHCYQQASLFLCPTPSMPMPDLPHIQTLAPIAGVGKANRQQLQRITGGNAQTRYVSVSLGGIGMQYPLETWPLLDNVMWLFPEESLYLKRADFISISQVEMTYLDLLASCDVVLTKIGYGTQTEAVINRIPAVCLKRGDWPEAPALMEWHSQQGEVAFIEWSDIESGHFQTAIQTMLHKSWLKPTIEPTGAQEAAAIIKKFLTV